LGGGNRPLEDVSLKPSDYVERSVGLTPFGGTMLNELRFNWNPFFVRPNSPRSQTNFGIPQIRIFDFDAGGIGDPVGFWHRTFITTRVRSLKNTYASPIPQSGASDSCFQVGVQYFREQIITISQRRASGLSISAY